MISPQKNETDAVIELLESREFDTPKQMAAAIVRKLSVLFEERNGYGVGISLPGDDLVLPHGPFYNIGDAKRTAVAAQERGLRAFIAPLYGAANALRDEEEAMDKRCVCGHPKQLHGQSMTPRAMTTLGCCVFRQKVKCDCRAYVADKR